MAFDQKKWEDPLEETRAAMQKVVKEGHVHFIMSDGMAPDWPGRKVENPEQQGQEHPDKTDPRAGR